MKRLSMISLAAAVMMAGGAQLAEAASDKLLLKTPIAFSTARKRNRQTICKRFVTATPSYSTTSRPCWKPSAKPPTI